MLVDGDFLHIMRDHDNAIGLLPGKGRPGAYKGSDSERAK